MTQSKIRRYIRHGMLPQLSVFEAVARLGSFTRAAEELYMAQPTVSVQIKKLTETIGLPVLEQVGKTMRITSVGKELQAACSELIQTLTRFEQKVADMRGLQTGTLNITASTVAKYFASRMLVEFAQAYPGIDVRMHVGHRQSMLDRIAANTDDLYIMNNPPSSDEVVSLRLLPNPIVVFARRDHPLAGQANIAFARFAAESLVVRESGSGTRMTTDRLFSEHGITPHIRMELGSNEAIREALGAGLGVSIMSRHSAGVDLDANLTVLDVEGFPLEAHWYLVYPVGKQLSLIAQTFLDFVRKETQRLGAVAEIV
ncbi:MAG TPA: LysR substrate-binding domain-containing protein [Burkholderiales bacterium]|nr:LysR substrate-binding domain-containing protein [Burkholderiales bacterium]